MRPLPRHGAAGCIGVLGGDEHAPRPRGECLRREAPAVHVVAGQADEEVAGANGP